MFAKRKADGTFKEMSRPSSFNPHEPLIKR